MKILLKTGLLFSFIVLLSSCVFQDMGSGMYLGEKDSCGFAVHQFTGSGVRWDSSNFPVSFYIHQSVPYEAQQNFIAAVDHWNIAWEEYLTDQGLENFSLFSIVDKNTQYSGSPGNDGHNMLFFVKDDFSVYENPRVQAITAMNSTRKGKIKDTDIIVNNANFRYFYDEAYNQEILLSQKEIANKRKIASSRSMGFWFRLKQQIKEWFQFLLKPFKKKKGVREIAAAVANVPRDEVDFASLMVHELGHVPGLAHFDQFDHIQNAGTLTSQGRDPAATNRNISVMEPKLAYGRVRRNIKEYDLNNLFCGYFESP